jgi:predicted Rossmann fold nucleotide-binding protein DprA/Smf involved in DNA uptake
MTRGSKPATSPSIPASELQPGCIQRFKDLQTWLDHPDFTIGSFPFLIKDKKRGIELKYTTAHVKHPERLYWAGAGWEILNEQKSVSFGGTVSPTTDGFQLAELLAQQAVAGFGALVVGGGVTGIDMAAHLGALDQAGRTVAVLGKPVALGLHPYIPWRTLLQQAMLKDGLLLSEYDAMPKDDDENREWLLQRDRIITALSDVFIAVECSEDSATVDAAHRAYIQGKQVFAIDWSRIGEKWHEPKNSGSLQLERERVAKLLPSQRVKDIRDERLLDEFHQLLSEAFAAARVARRMVDMPTL